MGFSRQEYCSGLPFPSPHRHSALILKHPICRDQKLHLNSLHITDLSWPSQETWQKQWRHLGIFRLVKHGVCDRHGCVPASGWVGTNDCFLLWDLFSLDYIQTYVPVLMTKHYLRHPGLLKRAMVRVSVLALLASWSHIRKHWIQTQGSEGRRSSLCPFMEKTTHSCHFWLWLSTDRNHKPTRLWNEAEDGSGKCSVLSVHFSP